MAAIITVVNGVFAPRNLEAVCTSGTEGVHSRGSEHYVGHALDWRIKHAPEADWSAIRDEIADRLGPDFDVLLELTPPHIHTEWDPK